MMRKIILIISFILSLAFVSSGCGGGGGGSGPNPTGTLTPTPTVSPTITPGTGVILPPPAGKLYHGVFPSRFNPGTESVEREDYDDYADAVGKGTAWIYFSNEWGRSREFPSATAQWIKNLGKIPYIRLFLWSEWGQFPESTFTLARIVSGDFDDDFRSWAHNARDFNYPLLVEYGTEVNGDWFPWNGSWNGGEGVGPERFRDAYKHIISIFREEGADNVQFVFHVNNDDWPQEEWNSFENYYPGDDYIDWLAVSAYGPQQPYDESWSQFTDILDAAYPRLAALSSTKPIIVAEFAACENHPDCDQAQWAESALTSLTGGRWPRIIGFSWWNEGWSNDDDPARDTYFMVQHNQALTDVFERLVGENQDVLADPVIGDR